MEDQVFRIDDIYVPVKRKRDLDPEKVASLAESILEEGMKVPIRIRRDKDERLVLVEGLHRLEACRALGEDTIVGILVAARQF